MIYLAVLGYAALSLIICLPAGRIMQRFDETRSATMFVVVLIAWPAIMIVGVVAYAVSPEVRAFTREATGVNDGETK